MDKRRLVSNTVEQSYAIEQLHEYWMLPNTRDIWIHGYPGAESAEQEPGVEFQMATRVIKNLHYLKHLNPEKPVTIHLHTSGGYHEEGMAIYDTIKAMPYHVTMICYTHARSMSSILFQAGDTRVMLPNSYFMFHRGTLEMGGDYTTVISNIEWSKKIMGDLVDIYVERAAEGKKFRGMSNSKIKSRIQYLMNKHNDVFLTAEEAIEYGFADKILEEWPPTVNGDYE